MLKNIYTLKLDIKQQAPIPTGINFVSADNQTTELHIEIVDGSDIINYSQVASAKIAFAKADGTTVQGDLILVDTAIPKYYRYPLGTNEIAAKGALLCSVLLYGSNGERLTASKFMCTVDANPLPANAVQSSSEYDALAKAVIISDELEKKLADFPHIKILGTYPTLEALQAAYPDGSALGGGFFIASHYYAWSIATNSWADIGELQGGGYTLPTASTTIKGGIKIDGITITIDGNGVASVVSGGGIDGKQVELQKSTTHIQWRYVGDAEWINLIALADITGAKGDTGLQGENGADGLTTSVNNITQAGGNITLTQDNIPSGVTNKAFTAAEQTKLSNITDGANVKIIGTKPTNTSKQYALVPATTADEYNLAEATGVSGGAKDLLFSGTFTGTITLVNSITNYKFLIISSTWSSSQNIDTIIGDLNISSTVYHFFWATSSSPSASFRIMSETTLTASSSYSGISIWGIN